ncbi:hypothetical protein DWB77_00232 [Streptomyces hundungensis]|uniref:Uncharacterized protein n=1 Tax=Streptomyces hundungensis TaxID=1077946 RepID=A0A387H373_9ACTN|nr:hypothetical protein [Streptomyces hundungensis]AYG78125.1 hypothetical protein DWB77_00232 [Streptomyces hundungensis]
MHVHITLFEGPDPLDVIARYGALAADGMATAGTVVEELASAQVPWR